MPRAGRQLYMADKLGYAMLYMFELSNGEAWPNLMYRIIDGRGPGLAPEIDFERGRAGAVILLPVLFGNVIVVSLFTSIVYDAFNRVRQALLGASRLTPFQKLWLEINKLCMASVVTPEQRPLASSGWKFRLFRVVSSQYFRRAVFGHILLTALQLSLYWRTMSDDTRYRVTVFGWILSYVYAVEVFVRLLALGVQQFFQYRWNRFDSLMVLLQFFGFLNFVSPFGLPTTWTLMLRVPRLFSVANEFPELQRLWRMIQYSVAALLSVLVPITLLYIVYGVIAVALFSGVPNGEFVTDYANFRRWGTYVLP